MIAAGEAGFEAKVNVVRDGDAVTQTVLLTPLDKDGRVYVSELWWIPGQESFTHGKIKHVSKGQEGGMMKFNIFLHDIEPGGLEKYQDALKGAGWRTDLTAMGEKGGMIAGQKGELGMTFMYNSEKNEGMLAVFSGMGD